MLNRNDMLKFAWTVTVALLLLLPSAFGQRQNPDEVFHQANQAHDAGDFEKAEQLYLKLVESGNGTVEVFYNAANTAFRQGKIGQAVLMYRRGWHQRPRDADVRANLQLTQQRNGALAPPRNIQDRFFQELSHREWSILLTAAYWLTVAAIALAVFLPITRRFTKPMIVFFGIILLTSLGGWFYWDQWQDGGEGVVIEDKQTALYEPREASTPFFSLPEGSIVIIEETFDDWAKVRISKDAGWIPLKAVKRVFPWKTGPVD